MTNETETLPTVEECRKTAVRLLREAELTVDLKAKELTMILAESWMGIAYGIEQAENL